MRILRRGDVHKPERDAALYVQGEMPERSRRRFESHLLRCEQCWNEVQQARAGRAVAERGRELSPSGLREDVRAAVAMSEAPGRRRVRILAPVTAAILAGLAVLGLLLGGLLRGGGPAQPGPIAAALASFRSDQAPASAPTLQAPPDLSAAGLHLLGGGRSSLGGMPVDAFWFTDGRTKVVLLLGSERFPEAVGAQERAGAVHGWRAADDGVHLVCADSPVSYLLMSRDGSLLDRAEFALRQRAIHSTP
jgi:anti-sigma factor RsiW